MTIKNKLIANVLFTACIIVALSAVGFFSIHIIQKALVHLTEKSTPFQIRTLELQRELQRSVAILLKVNAARTMAEYTDVRAEAEASLARIEEIQKKLAAMNPAAQQVSGELTTMARELFSAVEERIQSDNAAISANEEVLRIMDTSAARLDALDRSIHRLQANYAGSFAAAQQNTGTFSTRLRTVEELRNLVRELQLITVTIQNMHQSSALLIARAKLKALTGRIAKNEYYASTPSVATAIDGFANKLAGYINLQSLAVARKDGDSKNRVQESGTDLLYKLNDLFQTLDQETMLARDELSFANSRQETIFKQSGIANNILETDSDLVELGFTVTSETNRLFTLESIEELNKLAPKINVLFTKIQERVKTVESALGKLHATEELAMLRTATASLTTIQTRIYAPGGIVTKLRNKLRAIKQATIVADRLNTIVVRQTVQGNKSISTAQEEQEKSLEKVHNTIQWTLSYIFSIGIAAIIIGIFFGFWIYRSILLPLRVVLDAVLSQQTLGKEKADLARAVADGDLSRDVVISEAIALDPAQTRHDEMGMVLKAVAGMSETQSALDRAFAEMTASLRRSRDEDARRDRLKNGLHELDRILREDYAVGETAGRALAFMAGFLGAGTGIIYRYDDQEQMLRPLSTYAISESERLHAGFRLGQGLAGQVALERKMICLDAVPPDYLPITSALGEAPPLTIAILPVMHNDILAGVLELGSFNRFSDDDFEFMNQSLEAIAISINVDRSRQRVNDLLEQTQTQAEELRAQQEELQQTNEELQERAKILAEQHKILVSRQTVKTT